MNADRDPYFTPAAWKEADQKRAKEIDRANAARVFTPTPKYPWEVQAEIVASKTAAIKALEIEVAALKKQVNRMERKLYRGVEPRARREDGRLKPDAALDGEILDALGRFPKPFVHLHGVVVSSYGAVSDRTLLRYLKRLQYDGKIRLTEDGWQKL